MTAPHENCGCSGSESPGTTGPFLPMAPQNNDTPPEDIACCGPSPGPPSGPYERPGYSVEPFVDKFIPSDVGNIPMVSTSLSVKDHLQTVLTRLNVGRNDYKIAPGIYATGSPDASAPVLVTANYKLSFDHLRKALSNIDAWILVLDTRGINVWCAAGKGTFGTGELINRIRTTGLEKIVSHKKIIVPQLGAPGVNGREVKKMTGFSVVWGPVSTTYLPEFISNGMTATKEMRDVTFTLKERLVLIPVELSLTLKPALIVAAVIFILAGIGPGIFSIGSSVSRGFPAVLAILAAIIGGTVITPAFLRQLPGTAFSVKGLTAGAIPVIPVILMTALHTGFSGVTAILLTALSVSSYLAMNFTGSTPFTSPSGVEKEMKKAIPIQLAAIIVAVPLWIYSGFN